MRRILPRGTACVLIALLAIAATSLNYVLAPVTLEESGGSATSTNYALRAGVGGAGGTSTSTNYILRSGFRLDKSPPPLTEAPVITSTAGTTATVATLYTYTVTATGTPAPAIVATGVPAWLTWASPTLSGTPAAGDVGTTGTITITASNGVNPDDVETFTIDVADAAPPSDGGGGGGGCMPGSVPAAAALLLAAAVAMTAKRR